MKRAYRIPLAVVLIVLAGWAAFRLIRTAALSPAGPADRPEVVRTAIVAEGPISQEVMLTGEVKALAEVALAPKVSGRLMELSVEEGASVSKGQRVALLDTEVFQAHLDQARAALEAARAGVKAAEAARESAERDYTRFRSLFGQGTSSQADLDSADSASKVASASVDVARASVLQAEAALQLAALNLREAALLAPFDAVVSRKLLDIGSFISAGAPILTLVSVDTVKIIAGVSERHLADVSPGETSALVTVDALPAASFPGTLYRLSPTIDQATRTSEAEIRIPNPSHSLKPGMYARVTLTTKTKPLALLMPADALLGREGAYYAYAVRDSRITRTPVEVGLRGASSLEVLSGLAPGMEVVTSGEGNLYDGAPVTVERISPPPVVPPPSPQSTDSPAEALQ